MQMPEPTEQHQKLVHFVGEWSGPEILHPSPWAPERREAVGRFTNRMGVDGMFLINDYEELRDGNVVFRGHGVYGWDAKRERYIETSRDGLSSSSRGRVSRTTQWSMRAFELVLARMP